MQVGVPPPFLSRRAGGIDGSHQMNNPPCGYTSAVLRHRKFLESTLIVLEQWHYYRGETLVQGYSAFYLT